MTTVNDIIANRIFLAKRKIELLQNFINKIENLKFDEFADTDDVQRTVDELFCSAYNSHPVIYDDRSYYYLQDCEFCPATACSFRKVLMKVRKCFNYGDILDVECRSCELLRMCKNITVTGSGNND